MRKLSRMNCLCSLVDWSSSSCIYTYFQQFMLQLSVTCSRLSLNQIDLTCYFTATNVQFHFSASLKHRQKKKWLIKASWLPDTAKQELQKMLMPEPCEKKGMILLLWLLFLRELLCVSCCLQGGLMLLAALTMGLHFQPTVAKALSFCRAVTNSTSFTLWRSESRNSNK